MPEGGGEMQQRSWLMADEHTQNKGNKAAHYDCEHVSLNCKG